MSELTARFLYSGPSDYWQGYSRTDNDEHSEYLLFAYYGKRTAVRVIVDGLIESAFDNQMLPEHITDDSIRKALMDMLGEQGRADYKSGVLADCSIAFAEANDNDEDYESPIFVVVLDYVKPEKNAIVVILGDDGVQDVQNIPDGYTVEVRDYDVPDDWENAVIDDDGDRYQSAKFFNIKG